MRDLEWYAVRVIINRDIPLAQKNDILRSRFQSAPDVEMLLRGTSYTYAIVDLGSIRIRQPFSSELLIGRITRSPKRTVGRRINSQTRQSREAHQDVRNLADDAEFIYVFTTNILYVHRRYPFDPSRNIERLWTRLLADPDASPLDVDSDIHAAILKDDDQVDDILDSAQTVTRMVLKIVQPNPGSSVEELDQIMEAIGADSVSLDAKSESDGLDASEDSFLRRSLRSARSRGYLKKATAIVDGQRHNLIGSDPTIYKSPGYAKDANNQRLPLAQQARSWIREILSRSESLADSDE